jgi:hypothetical protein
LLRKLKRKIAWEAFGVALDGLIEHLRCHTVQPGQVGVEQNALAAHDLNGALDLLRLDRRGGWFRHANKIAVGEAKTMGRLLQLEVAICDFKFVNPGRII